MKASDNSETATTFIRPRKVPGYSNLNLKAALYIRWSFTKIEEGFFDFVSRPENRKGTISGRNECRDAPLGMTKNGNGGGECKVALREAEIDLSFPHRAWRMRDMVREIRVARGAGFGETRGVLIRQ